MKNRYRILTAERKIKFTGTGLDSWFFSIESAIDLTDYSKGESVYQFDNNGEMLWEVL